MPHDRTLDHFGVENATATVLAAPVGRYAARAVLQDVLVDLDARLAFIEANPGVVVLSFTADAYILKIRTLSADAYIFQGQTGSFTAGASLHGTVTKTFTASAYFIDDVS